MWIFNTTPEYVKCCDNLGISDDLQISIKNWVQTVNRTPSNRNKLAFRSLTSVFEIWVARIPDPDHNIGSSGGFRLVYILRLKECEVYVNKMEKRSNIGFHNERPKDKERSEKFMKQLKEELVEMWGS